MPNDPGRIAVRGSSRWNHLQALPAGDPAGLRAVRRRWTQAGGGSHGQAQAEGRGGGAATASAMTVRRAAGLLSAICRSMCRQRRHSHRLPPSATAPSDTSFSLPRAGSSSRSSLEATLGRRGGTTQSAGSPNPVVDTSAEMSNRVDLDVRRNRLSRLADVDGPPQSRPLGREHTCQKAQSNG